MSKEDKFSCMAEQQIIGAIMQGIVTYERMLHFVNASEFYFSDYGLIFRVMGRIPRDTYIDPITVAEELERTGPGAMDEVGGMDHLIDLLIDLDGLNIELKPRDAATTIRAFACERYVLNKIDDNTELRGLIDDVEKRGDNE